LLDFLVHCTPGAIVAIERSGIAGQCAVGAFSKEKIAPSEVVAISGMAFVFKENELAYFNGKTLDHRSGAFCVESQAI